MYTRNNKSSFHFLYHSCSGKSSSLSLFYSVFKSCLSANAGRMDDLVALGLNLLGNLLDIGDIAANDNLVFAIRLTAGHETVDGQAAFREDARDVVNDTDFIIDEQCQARLALLQAHDIDERLEDIRFRDDADNSTDTRNDR